MLQQVGTIKNTNEQLHGLLPLLLSELLVPKVALSTCRMRFSVSNLRVGVLDD
jgi:hypothetical protein